MPDADSINENAAKPKSVAADGQSVQAHSIKDQIDADKYARGRAAQENGGLGIRLMRISTGGARPR